MDAQVASVCVAMNLDSLLDKIAGVDAYVD